ncbi:MAG: alpha/beta hydrolase [Hydrotalea sp. AMD]|uniref:dienelactone hydrolase family protein n=1 Tax=Hydrotalea TaxID=1004300 RepID=UPI000942429D|nr:MULTISPECIES: dienelactone hydrolase family protein [Hydrotalea]RWZ85904.1 MAG: alpha/beta hydrolase [Hydrotalea sp. AMD]
MKNLIVIAALLFTAISYGQNERLEDYGIRHLQTVYRDDTVDILIKSKKGEEQKRKPLFLFCQGSLPIPLIIKYDDNGKKGIYPVFVFNPDSLANEYHLAVISKPYVPLIADQKSLNTDLTYKDSMGKFPKKYIERNLLDYYVDRDIAVIKFLQSQSWISNNKLVVAGHSEGSTIAAKIAYSFPKVTQLIYSGGNPFGRIVTIVEQQRAFENDTTKYGEQVFDNWKNIIDDPTNMQASQGDAYKATYQFSIPPPLTYLEKLKIPVLITYGTKDYSSPFNDYFRVKMIEQKKTNFNFKAYIGVEHNFFPLKANGETNFDLFNWDKVADDWRQWLMRQ